MQTESAVHPRASYNHLDVSARMNAMIEIPLSTRGKKAGLYTAFIDPQDEDLALLNWCALTTSHSKTTYARRTIYTPNGKPQYQYLHRVILERMLPLAIIETVDHIDRNGLNNTRANLRPANYSEQQMNTGLRSDNKTGFRGVGWHKESGKFRSRIALGGKYKHLGLFDSAVDAYAAYCEARDKLTNELGRQ